MIKKKIEVIKDYAERMAEELDNLSDYLEDTIIENDKIILNVDDLIYYLNNAGVLADDLKEEIGLFMKYYNKRSDENA